MIKKFEEYNESVRDKMTPKTEEDIDEAFDKIAEDVADILIGSYDYEDFSDAYTWAIDHKKTILDMIGDDGDYEIAEIIDKILYGYEGARTSH